MESRRLEIYMDSNLMKTNPDRMQNKDKPAMKEYSHLLIICMATIAGLFFNNVIIAQDVMRFSNISLNDGLSNLNITSITQDKAGYMWFATRRGLNRYDGQEFKHYLFSPEDSASIFSNNINSLYSHIDGKIYIGTNKGLCYYDCEMGKIGRLFPEYQGIVTSITGYEDNVYVATLGLGVCRITKDGLKLEQIGTWNTEKSITVIFTDNHGQIWFGLDNGNGLGVYNNKSGKYDFFKIQDTADPIKNNTINYFHQASDDLLIIGTNSGVSYFDIINKEFVFPSKFQKLSNVLQGKEINFIFEYAPHDYWYGTQTEGLYKFNSNSQCLDHFSFSEQVPYSIHSNTYMVHFIDKIGNIWLGSFDNGIDVHFKQTKIFNTDATLNEVTKNEFITGVARNKDKLIITTRKEGFILYNLNDKTYKKFTRDNSKLGYPYIRSLLVDSRNQYWIGTNYSLHTLDLNESNFKTLQVPEPNNGIVSLHETNKMIFAGINTQGLLIYDLDGNKLFHSTEYGTNITRIIQLNNSEVFFSSYDHGLYAMNVFNFSVRKIEIPGRENDPGFMSVITAYLDDDEILWLGTYNYGLLRLDLKRRSIINFSMKDGLPSSDVLAIEEDLMNNLWLSTSFGLIKFNKDNYAVKKYFANEGINNIQFHEKASFRDQSGMIYFGGNFGLTYFRPNEIDSSISPSPKIILENLYINNKEVVPESQGKTLNKSLSFTDEITLTHKEKNFSINYLAFDYFSSHNIKYSFMLKGFDKEWQDAGNLRRVSYSNLKRGRYEFKVKAINNDGVWSDSTASLKINIKPAPWFSGWAWATYVIVTISIIFIILQLLFRAAVVRKKLELEQMDREREKEINTMKLRFFSNIAHEFRTPLTLIGGVIQHIEKLEKIPREVKEYIQIAGLNISRLLKLVNQLLAFKMMESETMSLWIEKADLNESIQKILKTFKILAIEKQINIDFIEDNAFIVYFDEDKIEKILSNLLSNAIKHTGKGGYIEITLKKISGEKMKHSYPSAQTTEQELASDYIEIIVEDNGIGMDDYQLKTVFNRYQSKTNGYKSSEDFSSIGIGLNFTKKLVELHKGFIKVVSKLNKGSAFSFVIPLDDSIYETQYFAENNSNDKYLSAEKNNLESEMVSVPADFKKVVIIAEDDPQLNSFLKNILRKYYTVFSAFNGQEALELVKQKQPDIIISDVMMSGMNGLELTSYLKSCNEFSHIPVILLTAKAEVENQIEGIKSGADYYIAKPFNIDYLLNIINSQLKNREHILNIFLNGLMPKLENADNSLVDVQFLSKLNQILEIELLNPDLGISLIAGKMNMSRSTFYRKFTNLTKLSPISYIMKYRINKSISLMQDGLYNIQEISDMSGFSSSSYFSTAFKQENNLTPTEYLNKLKTEKIDIL